jgi:peptide/nickel transport system substrate-binding protein
MRQSRWAVLVAVVTLAGACGGDSGEVGPWSLDTGVEEIGDGIPFCDAAMARVAEYMGQFEGQVPPDERYGGTAVVGAVGELAGGLNGHVSASQEGFDHQASVSHMTLVRYDAELNPVPYLAESWEISDDNTEVTFHIRNDVYWHDGELTDAYDVAYTFQRSVDPETGFPNPGYWALYDRGPSGVEVVDSFTVTFRMQHHAEFLDAWRQTPIMPQHLLEDVSASELRQHPYGTVCPVGNGPFVFVQHRQDANWTFQGTLPSRRGWAAVPSSIDTSSGSSSTRPRSSPSC